MATQGSYQGLARKWRPQRFEDLVGQEAVAASFQSALRQDRLSHAHILTGPRGVGKTTSARILAKAINCETGPTATPCGTCRHCLDITQGNDLDVIEIDAASNNGVDDIRELRERVNLAPFASRYKVYIIDEFHMLSTAAFNALLKTLEEPPSFVVFILATTDFEKVPETIRSRCVVHNFRRLGAEDIARRLAQVAEGEGAQMDAATAAEVYGLIAQAVEGGMRDALVAFDQLLAMTDGKPDAEAAARLLGLAERGVLRDTVTWLAGQQSGELLALIEDLVDRGRSLERYVKGLIGYLRDLMLLHAGADGRLVALTGETLKEAQKLAASIPTATLYNILNQLFELEERLKSSTQARFLIEFTFMRLAAIKPVVPMDEILNRIKALPEDALAGASAPAAPAPAVPARPLRREAPRAGGVAAAVMFDSVPPAARMAAEEASAPKARPAQPVALAGLPREAMLNAVVEALPESSRFLARYLRQAAEMRIEDDTLVMRWPADVTMARSFAEKPENRAVLESALEQITGQPMRYRGEAGGEASSAQATKAAAPRGSGPIVPPVETIDATPGNFSSAAIFGDLDEPPQSPSRQAADPQEALQAEERAKPLLDPASEPGRRIKLLRDMFSGTLIDAAGRPLSI